MHPYTQFFIYYSVLEELSYNQSYFNGMSAFCNDWINAV